MTKVMLNENRWTLKPEIDKKQVEQLSNELNGISKTLCKLLIQRGVDSFDKARGFFRPSLDNLHDPFLMKDMDKAVNRLEQALEEGEKLMIYGDYDVDGTTAVSLVYSFLKERYNHVVYYIPDRYGEGYGVSFQGIDFAHDNDIKLIIALDCGIKAVDKVAYAKEKGIDFIICDHHRPGDTLPDAVAVLDPKRTYCEYPYKELSGCGVGFKLLQAFSISNNIEFQELYRYLDLLAISIAADIVPITGENRILTHYGLEKINTNPLPGIQAIMGLLNNKKEFSVTDVVFLIAPRINAAGRIDSGKCAVELMIESNMESAINYAKQIDEFNRERRELDEETTKEALAIIESDSRLMDAKSTVVHQDDWHKGVIGIVASRLTEHYYRPTIVLTKSGEVYAGSARSVVGFDVYEAIEACSDSILQFGGHKYAAGLTLLPEQLDNFKTRFEEEVSKRILEEHLIPEISVDSCLDLSEINASFLKILYQFSPCGPDNMKPTFLSENLMPKWEPRAIGEDGKHLKMTVFQMGNNKVYYDAIGFGLGHLIGEISKGNPFSMVYSIEENHWNGKISQQLMIKDIKFREAFS
jgi:single-stranded-DNA-specific exonuclease